MNFNDLKVNFGGFHHAESIYDIFKAIGSSFYRGLAMRILSVRHTRDPWQNGRKIGPDFYTIGKNIYPSFLRRRMVGGGRPLLGEILGQPTPVGAKSPIFNQ